MAVDQKVSIFTTALRTEFETSYQQMAVATPPPWEQFTTKIPSNARIEHYPWMSPAPGLGAYQGHRRFGKLDVVKYSLENKEFDAAFSVLLRDIEDDQTGGYMLKPKELAKRAADFPGRWALKHLAAGETRLGFDGTAMFADSHTIGTGDNLLAFNGAADDAVTFNLAALYVGGPLKPLLWQDRKGPQFKDNAGTPASDEAKEAHYWIDMEGEAGYGYWWDAVWVNITDTPTVNEFQTILGNITNAFRTFRLPKALTSDEEEYVHEQQEFNSGNLILVGSTGLERIAAQVLGQEMIPQTVGGSGNTVATTNLYKNFAKFVPSAYMN